MPKRTLAQHAIVPLVVLLLTLGGCTGAHYGQPGQRLDRRGDEIVVCGQLYHTGAPVVLWTDPGGYDAYRVECRFVDRDRPADPVSDWPVRYSTMRRHLPDEDRARVRADGWRLEDLQEHVDLFVMHYDVCGTSRRCFQVLQDRRGLSVHFMLDLDGTIYQTLDLKERAWHAGSGNDRSVGVEIANMGAYEDWAALEPWYMQDDAGRTWLTFPDDYGPTGIRDADVPLRPCRNEMVIGRIHDRTLHQYDLTEAQYESLGKLVATVSEALPRIQIDCPRQPDGAVVWRKLSDDELDSFSGLIGHYHLTENKVDPGPAFNWERVIHDARRYAGGWWW
jgi:N-acetylmuramoyl-L-alanine amidase